MNKYVSTLENSILGKKWEYKIEEDWSEPFENSWDDANKNNLRVKLYVKRMKQRVPGQENYNMKTKDEDLRLMTIAIESGRTRHWSSNKREDCVYCYMWDKTKLEMNYPSFTKFAWTAFLLMFKRIPDDIKKINPGLKDMKLFDLKQLSMEFLTIDQLAEPETLADII
jgi:hypothetical protein